MTVCLYSHPGPISYAVTDCMLTPESESKKLPLSPANFHFSKDRKIFGRRGFVRKTFFSPTGHIVSFSGRGSDIQYFWDGLYSIAVNIDPADFVTKAEEAIQIYNQNPIQRQISMLVLGRRGTSGQIYDFLAENALEANTYLFGSFATIGSGRQELKDIFEEYGKNNPVGVRNPIPYEMIVGATGAANGYLLYPSEAQAADRLDWGGYLQLRTFNEQKGDWSIGPSYLHIPVISPSKGLGYFIPENSKVVAYRPSASDHDTVGVFLASGGKPIGGRNPLVDGIWSTFQISGQNFIVSDPLVDGVRDTSFWPSFRPERITFTSKRPWSRNVWTHRTLDLNEMSEVEVRFGMNDFEIKISPRVVRKALYNLYN